MQSIINTLIKTAIIAGDKVQKLDNLTYRNKVCFQVLDILGNEIVYKGLHSGMVYKDTIEYIVSQGMRKAR